MPDAKLDGLLSGLPEAVRQGVRHLTSPSRDAGVVAFRGILDKAELELPGTPVERNSKQLQGHWTDGLLLLVADSLGTLMGYADEKDGMLVHDVYPVRGEERRIENSGAVDFGLHTENVHHPLRPDYLGLLCLRQDRAGEGRLRVSSVRHALPLLEEHHIEELFKPNFYSLQPTSFVRNTGLERPSTWHTVLFGDERRPGLRYNTHNTKAVGEAANSALAALTEALREVGREVKVGAGDLILLDNHMVPHGRSAFTPRYDGGDRWLRRFYALRAISEGVTRLMPRPRVLPALEGAEAELMRRFDSWQRGF